MYFEEDPQIPTNFVFDSLTFFGDDENESRNGNDNVSVVVEKKTICHTNNTDQQNKRNLPINNGMNSLNCNNEMFFQDFKGPNVNPQFFSNGNSSDLKFGLEPEQDLNNKMGILGTPILLGNDFHVENENENEKENVNKYKKETTQENKNEKSNSTNSSVVDKFENSITKKIENLERTKIINILDVNNNNNNKKNNKKKMTRRIRTRSQTKLFKEQGQSLPEFTLDFSQDIESVKQRKRRRRGSGEKKNKMIQSKVYETSESRPIAKKKGKCSKSAPDYNTDYDPHRKNRQKGKRKKKDWLKMGVQLTEEEKRKWKEISGKSHKNLTLTQKRDRKLLRDRISARHSRQKKKEYISSLEEKVSSLEKEKSLVDQRMMHLEEENQTFKEKIKQLRELAFSENILTAPLLSQLSISSVSEKNPKLNNNSNVNDLIINNICSHDFDKINISNKINIKKEKHQSNRHQDQQRRKEKESNYFSLQSSIESYSQSKNPRQTKQNRHIKNKNIPIRRKIKMKTKTKKKRKQQYPFRKNAKSSNGINFL
ncbi:basic-leucine zipper transcription factor f-related [Anaeramoeba flamelloides]|uniref:Basic-leucine zipper transcription factor f-related n=1 Tax=Anaeramoeba flamelloides TaxID=1746091 RepID=A0ABQ8Y6U7_9EUKA|nr:basic-leucine zipper transcription factor f-related [Anaeramoeba flamelloides]